MTGTPVKAQPNQYQNHRRKTGIISGLTRRNENTMALTLLPAVDVRDGKAVRLRQGESGSETDYGSPLEAARTWVESGAQWIHLVDLDAAFGTGNNRDQLGAIVKELGDKVNIELSGGVRDDDSLDAALQAGAARVNIGTAALENPEWTASVIKKYGDRVAVGLDVRGHTLAARGWVKEGGDLFETMTFLDSVGCSRYVVTDVARDGMMSGPNLTLLREVAERTDAHVTASGGISSLDDLRAIKELAPLGVDAAILGKSLYARAFTLEEALNVAQ
ncbi:1-(5-phosphoribosyl)-5-[(5- phosphoribosylamino)m ethylideneamino] imidazole-4-carboxamide isomerase [Bifidobacterium boum]|uniref:1-(5-phosphoribosyl)-5-[(5-phosphoribosylamino)methylideneamino] imidazole-4-carboxamide isomerase n=2 Tax=Bifidobacterium boum TaxID=78343 RepID=A0A086ZPT0_9BIFI|nr:1-(5-phosphoribosyl)-5-[(5- phosphoribosylamino)m ethylideneamino] imidazole-4-carboxamide isomerase [Bifidobacterium boum]